MISYLLSGWRVYVPDENGNPLYRGRVYFYDASTSEPSTVYSDKDQATSLGTYVDVDNHGYLPAVWLAADHLYKVVVKRLIQADPETWQTLWEIDDVGNPFLTSEEAEGESSIAVNSISELKAINPLDSERPDYVYVMGWFAPGDAGSPMLFRWVPNASGNDGHWIDPNVTGVGAWEQLFDGDLDPRKFGAVPDSGNSCDVSLNNCMLYATEPHTYDSSDHSYYRPKTVHFVKEGNYALNAAFDFTAYTMISQYGSSPVPVVIDDGVFFNTYSVTLGNSARVNSSSPIGSHPVFVDKEGVVKFSWFYSPSDISSQAPRAVFIDKDTSSTAISLNGKVVVNMLDSVPAGVSMTDCVLLDAHDGSVSPTLLKLGKYVVSHGNGSPKLLSVRYNNDIVFKFENEFATFVNELYLKNGWQVNGSNYLKVPYGESDLKFLLNLKASWDITSMNGSYSDIKFDKMSVTTEAAIRRLDANLIYPYNGNSTEFHGGVFRSYGTPLDLSWTSYGSHGIPADTVARHIRITTKGYSTPLDYLYIDIYQQATLYQLGQVICIENCGDRLPGATFSDLYANGDMNSDVDDSRPIFVIRQANQELVDVVPPFSRKHFRYDGSKFVAVSI